MSRWHAGLLSLAVFCPQLSADPTPLNVAPAPIPKPSLKYLLLPDRDASNSDNAATLYYRSLALFFESQRLLEDSHEEYWEKWLHAPLEELRAEEVLAKLSAYDSLLREVEIASRCRRCDWQLNDRREGMGLVVPDLPGFRHLGRVLIIRARREIALGNHETALAYLRTGFALSHHLGEGPFGIHVLVGAAIGNWLCDSLEELSQTTGAPNLYWALTTLPRPFINPQLAIRDQSEVFEHSFPWLKQMEQGPLQLAQVQQYAKDLQRFVDGFNIRKPEGANLLTATRVTASFGDAKRYLIDHGIPTAAVEAMPQLQVVMLAAFREYREAATETTKWVHVENGFKTAGYKAAKERYKDASEQLDRLFFFGLLRALQGNDFGFETVVHATNRVDQRIAALRCVEAVRQYAAAHPGKLPSALANVADCPAPNDPVTGKPFEYKLTEEKATLTIPRISEDRPELTYVITLRR